MQLFNSRTEAENDTDIELVERCARQCRVSFQKLYERHYESIIRLSYRYLNDTSLVEDVANETLFTVWQKAGTFRRESRVKTWILGIAVLKCREIYRRQSRQRDRECDAIGSLETVADEKTGSSPDLQRDIQNALQSLSPDHRSCIELAYVGGYSGAEIAQILGCPLNTVKTRLHYAKKHLKNRFVDQRADIDYSDYAAEFTSRAGD